MGQVLHGSARPRMPFELRYLAGLTPYEAICKAWNEEPDRFIADPAT
jgi:hypothetical protein